MSRLTRDGTAEPVSRDQILRHARGQGNTIFPVQLTTSRIGNLTRLIHTLLYVMTIHTYTGGWSHRICVCVFFPFILDIKFSVCMCVFSSHSFWTSSSLDVPAGVTQEEGHTGGRSHRMSHPPSFCGACLHFSREKDSAVPFPRRP